MNTTIPSTSSALDKAESAEKIRAELELLCDPEFIPDIPDDVDPDYLALLPWRSSCMREYRITSLDTTDFLDRVVLPHGWELVCPFELVYAKTETFPRYFESFWALTHNGWVCHSFPSFDSSREALWEGIKDFLSRVETAEVFADIKYLLSPETGSWIEPDKDDYYSLAHGYYLEKTATLDKGERLEGLKLFEAHEWSLRHNGSEIGRWAKGRDADPEDIFEGARPYIPADLFSACRLSFYLTQPSTREHAAEVYAGQIWEKGEMLAFLKKICAKIHVGDTQIIRAMLLSYAATRVENSEGIHISISGRTGTGKSHAAVVASSCLPKSAVVNAHLSDKSLYYHPIKDRSVLILDDQEMSPDFQELFKTATSDWDHPGEYKTVARNAGLTLALPRRCVFWVCKVDLNGDDQVLDRQLLFWTDESDEQRKSVHAAIMKRAEMPRMKEGEDTNFAIARALWGLVEPKVVSVPFANRVRCDPMMDSRNLKLMFCLVEAHALLHSPVRRSMIGGDLLAEEEDFYAVMEILEPLFANQKGSQHDKLSKSGARILAWLCEQESGLIPFGDIRVATGLSQSQLSHALYGKNEQGSDGLLAQTAAIGVERLSETRPDAEDPELRRSENKKVVRWNRELYQKGGMKRNGFWLAER